MVSKLGYKNIDVRLRGTNDRNRVKTQSSEEAIVNSEYKAGSSLSRYLKILTGIEIF